MERPETNLKYELQLDDRIGIVFDIAGMLTTQGLNIISMEVIKKGSITSIFFEIEPNLNTASGDIDLNALFGTLKGLRKIKQIKTLPQEKREQRFRVLIDGVSDGIISVNEKGIISTINNVACSIFSLNSLDVLGKNITNVLPENNILHECLKKKVSVSKRNNAITSHGRVEFFSTAKPVHDSTGQFVGALALIQDLKEVKGLVEIIKKPIQTTFEEIIGQSSIMRNLKSFAMKIAHSDNTISIRGESGTGKEILARAIHFESGRQGPFIPINCAAMPETLLESELFGYEAGTFTGARKNGKIGLFEVAGPGTIFLDEIGDMPQGPQAKILRVLQEGTLRRIGGSREITINARIITATNKNLEQMVYEKKFREDLYYRINVLPIHIPPLKERIDDIKELVNLFLFDINSKLAKKNQTISEKALNKLKLHHWPGNVRELKNVIERASIIADTNKINYESIIFSHETKTASTKSINYEPMHNGDKSLKMMISEIEKEIIEKALKNSISIRKTAKQFRISHTALLNKIKKYNIHQNRSD